MAMERFLDRWLWRHKRAWVVRYPDGCTTVRLSYDNAKACAEIFNGRIIWIGACI